jgi:hypothetical protein
MDKVFGEASGKSGPLDRDLWNPGRWRHIGTHVSQGERVAGETGCPWPSLWSRVVFPTDTKGVSLGSVDNTTRD